MDITKSNFQDNIENIKSTISNASFLAIDCEFSGLNIDEDTRINAFDSFEQYYLKQKRNVTNFLVLQFGLCAFEYDATIKKFKQKCFNFYLFPRPINNSRSEHHFVCQSSCIEFLCNHKFNFNKVFNEGITYLNSAEEDSFRDILVDRLKTKTDASTASTNNSLNVPIPDDDKSFIDDIMIMIENFLANSNDELMLPTCNSFRRRLIYQTSRERFGSNVNLETRIIENKDRVLFVLKPEPPEKIAIKERQKIEMNLAELEEAVGFSRIIQFISQSGKLMVGHNLALDLLHTIDKFLIPLPDSYDEFKNCASCLFTNIIDTKVLATTYQFKDLFDNTILSGLVNTFKTKGEFKVPEIILSKISDGYVLDDDRQHEAGYDAYLTGVCFLTMARYLDNSDNYFSVTSEGLKPFLNKIFAYKLQDCGYFNLAGPDPKPSRDHVMHITFPIDWKACDITHLFSPFGNVFIAWINENSAYISLYKRDQAALALSQLSQSDKYKLISYARHQTIINARPYLSIVNASTSPSKKRREPTVPSNFKTKKRRREIKFGESSKPTFMTIAEEPEDSTDTIATKMTKMFDETSTWD